MKSSSSLLLAGFLIAVHAEIQAAGFICWIKGVEAKGTSALVSFDDRVHVQGYIAAATDLLKPISRFEIGGANGNSLEVSANSVVYVRGGPHSSCELQLMSREGSVGLLVKATESNRPPPHYFDTVEQFVPLK